MVELQKNNIVRTFPIEKLEILVTLVFEDQLSDEAIAEHFGFSKPTLYKLKKTLRFQKILMSYSEIAARNASASIKYQTQEAVSVLVRLMKEGSETIQLKAAIEVIRIGGLCNALPAFTLQSGLGDQGTLLDQQDAHLDPVFSKNGHPILDGRQNVIDLHRCEWAYRSNEHPESQGPVCFIWEDSSSNRSGFCYTKARMLKEFEFQMKGVLGEWFDTADFDKQLIVMLTWGNRVEVVMLDKENGYIFKQHWLC